MKMQFQIEGKVVTIEAEGAVSVQVRDARPVPVSAPASVPEVSEPPALVLLPSAPAECGLFAKLASLRKQLSVELNVPPYVIFHDKTLREMAEKAPASLSELGKVGGVGAAKLEKFGARFLEVLQGAAA